MTDTTTLCRPVGSEELKLLQAEDLEEPNDEIVGEIEVIREIR